MATAAQNRVCARYPGSCSSPGRAAPSILGIVVAAPSTPRAGAHRQPLPGSGAAFCRGRKTLRKGRPGVAMATYSLANERLRALEDIEREIGAILQNAGSGHDGRRPRSQQGGEGPRGPAGGRAPRGLAPASPGQPQPSVGPRRYRDPGAVQGEDQRTAAGPAGGGLHGVGAARGGRAVGADPLPHPGACGRPRPAPPPRPAGSSRRSFGPWSGGDPASRELVTSAEPSLPGWASPSGRKTPKAALPASPGGEALGTTNWWSVPKPGPCAQKPDLTSGSQWAAP